jgi:hypothetical protein
MESKRVEGHYVARNATNQIVSSFSLKADRMRFERTHETRVIVER